MFLLDSSTPEPTAPVSIAGALLRPKTADA